MSSASERLPPLQLPPSLPPHPQYYLIRKTFISGVSFSSMYARFKVYPSCSRMTSAYGGINTPFKYFLFFLCMPVGSGSPLKNISNLLTFLAVSCCTCKPILQSCMCLKHKDKQRSTRHSIFLLFPIDILFKSLLIHSVMLV